MDEQGDAISGVKDLRAVYYATNSSQDSLWLKFTFYESIDHDFGAAIGLDTNLNTNDGALWGGNNQSMNSDVIIYLERNGFFQTHITSSSPLVRSIVESDTNELIVNFKYSDISYGQNIHMVAGSGSFDISSSKTVYDDIPNVDYLQIIPDTLTTGLTSNNKVSVQVFPNPASTKIKIAGDFNSYEFQNLSFYNSLGRKVMERSIEKEWIDISALNRGMYFLVIDNGLNDSTTAGTLVVE